MNDVGIAERKSTTRAILFYLMALTLLLSTWIGVGAPFSWDRLGVWLAMVLLVALNLTPLSTVFRRAAWVRLVEDETTRAHRQMGFAAGFWAGLASAGAMALVATLHTVTALDVSRVVISAALCAALVSFATLELRAARG